MNFGIGSCLFKQGNLCGLFGQIVVFLSYLEQGFGVRMGDSYGFSYCLQVLFQGDQYVSMCGCVDFFVQDFFGVGNCQFGDVFM